MTYSKRTRELAAQLCSMAASDWAAGDHLATTYRAANQSGYPARAQKLAGAAWQLTTGHHDDEPDRDAMIACVYAEAEALIRTGWTP